MEQHPVPQQISAYHFRLVGDMTIKQFLELAGGIGAAWIFYSLPIPSVFRWPLVIFSVFSGVALAFLPLEERPLDRWFVAFIKAIYSPTQYLWKKSIITPSFFEEIKKTTKQIEEKEQTSDQKRLQSYLESLPVLGPQTGIDKKENRFITDIMRLYTQVQPTTASMVKPKRSLLEEERIPKVAVRKLKTPPLDPKAMYRGEIIMPKRQGKPRKIEVPKAEPTALEDQRQQQQQQVIASKQAPRTETLELAGVRATGAYKPQDKQIKTTQQATLKPELPIPAPPTEPNVIVGMVLDKNGNITENAVVTIKDPNGNVARAQKTNKIGQFFIFTPLQNGAYEIEVEKQGLAFDIIKIELKGEPVPPVEIRAKNVAEN